MATDFSQSVGPLKFDAVSTSYEMAVDMAIRTAVAEIICIGGTVEALTFTNSMGDRGYSVICKLVEIYERRLSCKLKFVVSSETNFKPHETAIGVTAIGKSGLKKLLPQGNFELRLIGRPYVGKEVLANDLPELAQIQTLIQRPDVLAILPVGSKGIRHEADYFGDRAIEQLNHWPRDIDIHKSAGPATCFLCTVIGGSGGDR